MLNTMHQRNWSKAHRLADYLAAPRGPGLYVIGHKMNPDQPMGPPLDSEGRLGGFPENFAEDYVGNTYSARYGIRQRLYRHYRGRGNRRAAEARADGKELWFCYIEGEDMAGYEAIFLLIPTGYHFKFNIRDETTRYFKRLEPALSQMTVVDPFLAYDPALGQGIFPRGPYQFGGQL